MVKIMLADGMTLESVDGETVQLRCKPPVPIPAAPKAVPSLGTIAVVNLSTTDPDSNVMNWTSGVQKQCNTDVAKFWGYSADLKFITGIVSPANPIPKADGYCGIFDTSDVAGAYGWHDTGPNNEPIVKVFTKDAEANGVSPSSILSHEICECIGDWSAAITVKGFDEQGKACIYYRENCDAVEAISYKIGDVEVSDFVTPAWFIQSSKAQLDFMSACTKPYEIKPGGYMQLSYDQGATWTEVNKASKRASMHASEHSRYAIYKKPLEERKLSTFETVLFYGLA